MNNESHIAGTVLRAGSLTEGRVTIEIETTKEQLRDFPFNMIGKVAVVKIAKAKPEPETPQPDADGWIPHRPGDPMPCESAKLCERIYRNGTFGPPAPAGDYDWTQWGGGPTEIIAWKPA